MDWNLILQEAIKNNPGVLSAFVSAFLVPCVILVLTNRHQRAMKELEKKLDEKGNDKSIKERHEDLVYGCLVKILFEVQRLYTDLSMPKCDTSCIQRALDAFRAKLLKYQSDVADNQIHLRPSLIECIYSFYAKISALEIELNTIDEKQVKMLQAAVAVRAEELAGAVISFHKEVADTRPWKAKPNSDEFRQFRGCCGTGLSIADRQAYFDTYRKQNEAP